MYGLMLITCMFLCVLVLVGAILMVKDISRVFLESRYNHDE